MTARLIVLAVMIGVVVAALSVPVGSVVMQQQSRIVPPLGASTPMYSTAEYFKRDGHMAIAMRRDFATGTLWEASTAPDGSMWVLATAAGISNARLVEQDPRPGPLRDPLDSHERLSVLLRAGWPLEAGYGVERWAPRSVANSAGVWKCTAFGQVWTVPYRPIWIGLIGNTLLYAAIALAIMVFFRRRVVTCRRAAGECVACGYELGRGVEICPECGLVANPNPTSGRVS